MASMNREARITTYREFWPFYLSEHSSSLNRRLHFVGTTIALVFIVMSIAMVNAAFLLAALVSGYGFAWFGHYFIEKNRPATFKYPMWSFVSDWRMWLLVMFRRPLVQNETTGPSNRRAHPG
jgi:hypothetical protein